jgi:hypothetical protein
MKPTVFEALARHMLSADWIIGAQRTHCQRLHQMVLEMPRLLHKAAKGPLRVRASRVKEYAEPLGHQVRVDALTYGTGRIAAARNPRSIAGSIKQAKRSNFSSSTLGDFETAFSLTGNCSNSSRSCAVA